MRSLFPIALFACFALPTPCVAQVDTSHGDEMLARYFEAETRRLADQCLTGIRTKEDWLEQKDELRRQLREMLGLSPLPEKTDLKVQYTGEVEHEEFVVKKLHYQSRPGLYVTGNLYLPKKIDEPLPAVLYVCGHGRVQIEGVNYGNKVHYQHHPAWYARNGYVCLAIDTLQLGEIEGIHHGTYREGMWWWLNRGYTPAGVEAWNCVRAIDYLQSLEEVDGERIGVTGRSGGGAYSWWIAALDERIKCAVPVAGITDLENHVIDGCVEGHCDCMFMVNTYRWDYPMLAALVAPRPLLISNTDSDSIFPLDGVFRVHQKVKRIYELLGAKNNVAFHITAGPHKDTQELRVHSFRWMNKHLRGDTETAVLPAEKFFEPIDLKVFESLPANQKNTLIQEDFVAPAETKTPKSIQDWDTQHPLWKIQLEERVFSGWPEEDCELNLRETMDASFDGIRLRRIEFDSQDHVRLQLLLAFTDDSDWKDTDLHVLGDTDYASLLSRLGPAFGHRLDVDPASYDEVGFLAWAKGVRNTKRPQAYFAPRGVGPTAWDQSEKKQIQNRRRFYLLGQTRDGMQVYDVRRATTLLSAKSDSITVHGNGVMAGIGLYASIFQPQIKRLELTDLPETHRNGPVFLNVRRYLDMPQAVAVAMSNKEVNITGDGKGFEFATETAKLLNREASLQFGPE